MKIKHAACLAAAAAALSAPVLAQSRAQPSAGTNVTPGAMVVAVDVARTPPPQPARVIPGSVVEQAETQTWVDGNQRTTVTTYWANVPANVRRNPAFQRWQSLP